mgnify:CR=1 FL=1
MAIKKGHCLCRQVTFEYSGPEIRIGHCHCESCRRTTLSGFTNVNATVNAAANATVKTCELQIPLTSPN